MNATRTLIAGLAAAALVMPAPATATEPDVVAILVSQVDHLTHRLEARTATLQGARAQIARQERTIRQQRLVIYKLRHGGHPPVVARTARTTTTTTLKIQDGNEPHQVGDYVVLTYGSTANAEPEKARVVLEWRTKDGWHRFVSRDVMTGSAHHYLARLGQPRDAYLRARTLNSPSHAGSHSHVVVINYEPSGIS